MKDFQHLIKASHTMNPHCPICEAKYDTQRIHILEESDNGLLSYFTCHNCNASFLASVIETSFGQMATGLLTDLQADEVAIAAQREPITHDDVLDAHQKLEKGDLI